MIISISGKIGSGKDLTGKIIQTLIDSPHLTNKGVKTFLDRPVNGCKFEIKKWADSLKDIVCILIGCTREQLENREFKEIELGEEWIRYGYADGFIQGSKAGSTIMNNRTCTKEKYELEARTNWQTAYKAPLTPRLILQLLGTQCGRDIIHNNIWVNSLMSKYTTKKYSIGIDKVGQQTIVDRYPNWIITDTRFPNELEAVKDRKGITIKLNRGTMSMVELADQHESERALDDATFDYLIENNSTIDYLIDTIRILLQREKIIN